MSEAEETLARLKEPAPSWGELRKDVDHADKAYEYLSAARFQNEPEFVEQMIKGANVHAKLAVTDKIEELIATIKLCTGQIIESQAKLDQDIQTAAQHLHTDAHELKAHLRVVKDERDVA